MGNIIIEISHSLDLELIDNYSLHSWNKRQGNTVIQFVPTNPDEKNKENDLYTVVH